MSKLIAFVLGVLIGFGFTTVIEQHAAAGIAQSVAAILPFAAGGFLALVVG